MTRPTIRREFRDSDADAIVELHRRVYVPEYDRNERFVADVAQTVEEALAHGWPTVGDGGVWLVERDGAVQGSVALTDEGDGVGQVRWVVFDPSVRGHGLGRALVSELVDHARAVGMGKLELTTFRALTTAAGIYRSLGFRVVWERERDDWGPTVTYQGYELILD